MQTSASTHWNTFRPSRTNSTDALGSCSRTALQQNSLPHCSTGFLIDDRSPAALTVPTRSGAAPIAADSTGSDDEAGARKGRC